MTLSTAISEVQTKDEFATLTVEQIENGGAEELVSVLSRIFGISVRDGNKRRSKSSAIELAKTKLAELQAVAIQKIEAQTAISRINNIFQSNLATAVPAAVMLQTTGSLDVHRKLYLMSVKISSDYRRSGVDSSITTPDQALAQTLKACGVKVNASLCIYEAPEVPLELIQEYLPGWEPKKRGEQFVNVTVTWAKAILSAKLDGIRKKYFTPVSSDLGWMCASSALPKIAAEFAELRELRSNLSELLQDFRIFQSAEQNINEKLETLKTASLKVSLEGSERVQGFIEETLEKFPEQTDLAGALTIEATAPQELPSLLDRLSADQTVTNTLAAAMDSETDLALAALKADGVKTLKAGILGQADRLQTELVATVKDISTKILKANGTCSDLTAKKLSEMKERLGALTDMLEPLTGSTPYAEIAAAAAAAAEAYTSAPDSRSDLILAFGGIQSEMQETAEAFSEPAQPALLPAGMNMMI